MRVAGARAKMLTMIGPGIAVAATGIGAGDIISATVAGSRFGLVVAWAALVGEEHRNGPCSNAGLVFSLLLFLYLGLVEISKRVG